jgi:hypothetical protein
MRGGTIVFLPFEQNDEQRLSSHGESGLAMLLAPEPFPRLLRLRAQLVLLLISCANPCSFLPVDCG